MMQKKRDRLRIIHDILKAIQDKDGRIKKTHILYKSNLSHEMLDEYLGYMIEKNFIKEIKIKDGRTYSLEPKGYDFLAKYKLITDFIETFGL